MFAVRKKWRLKLLLVVCLLIVVFLFLKSDDEILKPDVNYSNNRRQLESTLEFTQRQANVSTTPGNPEPKTMVILLTYMRSGSSFTGDLIQQHPDVFYVYEPLYTISKFKNANTEKSLRYFNKRDRVVNKNAYNSLSMEMIESILTCNILNVDIDTLRQYHYRASLTTSAYLKCLKQSIGVMGTISCLPLIQKQCDKSKLTLVKVIRLDLKVTKVLLEKYPTLKIIHLIRDPRGTLRSQRMVGEFNIHQAKNDTKAFCDRVSSDLQSAVTLKKKYPNRILTMRYDDIAEEPIKKTEEIYEFLGLEMTKTIRNYVWNITSAGQPDNCIICTTRNSSVATAYKWRTILKYDLVSIIDKTCSYVYNKLGYLPLKSLADQRNMSVKVKKPIKLDF